MESGQAKANAELVQKWLEHQLDEVEECPQFLAKVHFEEVEVVELGQVITPTQAKNPPKVSFPYKPGQLYAVFMMDPDAPNRERPSKREWYHWSVLNISENNVADGDTVVKYVGPGPPAKSGLHRYVVLVYEQPGRLRKCHDKIRMSADGRAKKSVRDIAGTYEMGTPLAGACFQAQYDLYVKELMSKLKG